MLGVGTSNRTLTGLTEILLSGISFKIWACPLFGFLVLHHNSVSAPQFHHYCLSSKASHISLTTFRKCPGMTLFKIGFMPDMSVTIRYFAAGSLHKTFFLISIFLISRILSSTLLPGFFGPGS